MLVGDFITAKLDAIPKLLEDNVKGVRVVFDNKENCWRVECETLLEEEWENLRGKCHDV